MGRVFFRLGVKLRDWRLQALAEAVRAACADSRLQRRGLGQSPSKEVFSRRRCGGYRLQAIAKAVRAACADSRLERRGLGQRPSNMGKAHLASPRKTSWTEATPATVEKSLSPARIAA